jgi:hypothetical protein
LGSVEQPQRVIAKQRRNDNGLQKPARGPDGYRT